MKTESYYFKQIYKTEHQNHTEHKKYDFSPVQDTLELNLTKHKADVSFAGNPISAVKDYFKFLKVLNFTHWLEKYIMAQPNHENLYFRNLSMECLEGIQYGIKVFKGLSMKDIQYLSENLHVIAVKRGCNNMCGYCYADAKPAKREMSWEDFTTITHGFKTLRKRLGNLPLFGENLPLSKEEPIYRTTEVFYDADCMNITIKDKKGKVYDMRDLVTEIYESVGRKSCFDTSGWDPNNRVMQQRAEQYAKYFSDSNNMDKLNQFNLSFNPFNASYIAGVKALKSGDVEKYKRLKGKYTDRIANAIFTFTPLLKHDCFQVLERCFGLNARNADDFNFGAMSGLIKDVTSKLKVLYDKDLNGAQKYVKTSDEVNEYMNLAIKKMERVNTSINSSGRMKQFMKTFGIQDNSLQDHSQTTPILYQDLVENGRHNKYIVGHKLIDTDGKVYHMDYARFFPTEIQLNIKDKTPTPRLANLREDCPVTKEMINKKEVLRSINDFI